MYIDRDGDGNIIALYGCAQKSGHEFVAGAVLHAFPSVVALQELQETDVDMARFVEDLYDVLINKGIIIENDLPSEALAKITNRKEKRAAL